VGVAERYPAGLENLLIPDPKDAGALAARLRHWRAVRERYKAAIIPFANELRSYTWDDMAERFIAAVDRTA
jgi:hypothetical protein